MTSNNGCVSAMAPSRGWCRATSLEGSHIPDNKAGCLQTVPELHQLPFFCCAKVSIVPIEKVEALRTSLAPLNLTETIEQPILA